MNTLRPPAVPLITVDPYFSIWSCTDKLYDDVTRHWTGSRQNLLGVLSVDGTPYRFMGKVSQTGQYPERSRVLPQTSVIVRPLTTVYQFENEQVRLELRFMTPLLMDDLKLLSRPVSYISYAVTALDGQGHDCEMFLGIGAEAALDHEDQRLSYRIYEHGICCGRGDRGVLAASGDNKRIDWGWLHLFSASHDPVFLRQDEALGRFNLGDWGYSTPVTQTAAEAEFVLRDTYGYLGLIKKFQAGEKPWWDFVCAGYDDLHSILYLGRIADAYYKKDGDTFADIQKKAVSEFESLTRRVEAFDTELFARAGNISPRYADIVSLAYRQSIAAHKLTWDGQELQFFSKECFSNGCIATLDVTYPSIPLFLLYQPDLVQGMLNPLFRYAQSGQWPYDFAPHDVGQYPIANGQVYGLNRLNGELEFDMQMPVEECGNAILCVYAVCHYKQDHSYAEQWLGLLQKWADYLVKHGVDPENQLCTDDFAGHLAHNCNLSAKAIMGISAFGEILKLLGQAEEGNRYIQTAKNYAKTWQKMAYDGDHYRLAFDQAGTWSVKYNLVWDRIFGWNIFEKGVFDAEVEYYKKKFNSYGLPLDSRKGYTKSDWLMWSVRMTEDQNYRDLIVDTMWNMLNESPSRVPFTDWYETETGEQVGFQNRTVQGGLFLPLL